MKRSLLLLPLMLLAAGFANASILNTYNTQASFDAALNPGYYDEPFTTFRSAASLGYSGGLGFSYRISDGYGVQTSNKWIQESGIAPDTITITFNSGTVTAIGADFFAVNWLALPTAATDTVTFSDGSSRTFSTTTSTGTFTGWVFSTPITSMTFNAGSSSRWAALDNLDVGTAAPEPGSWTLLVAGAGLLALAKRRRR